MTKKEYACGASSNQQQELQISHSLRSEANSILQCWSRRSTRPPVAGATTLRNVLGRCSARISCRSAAEHKNGVTITFYQLQINKNGLRPRRLGLIFMFYSRKTISSALKPVLILMEEQNEQFRSSSFSCRNGQKSFLLSKLLQTNRGWNPHENWIFP